MPRCGYFEGFKIDLIVWKWLFYFFVVACQVWFKIDLIVWKSSTSPILTTIAPCLK